MRFFFFFVVTFFVINFEADAMEIECEFLPQVQRYGNIIPVCHVQSFKKSSNDDCVVTSVTGNHWNRLTKADILRIYFYEKNLTCFPKDLRKILNNLDTVIVGNGKISTLSRSDLQSLGSNLKKLYFNHNQIEVIPSDLFEDTRNLEEVSFGNNKIKHVEKGSFDKLWKLSKLYFGNNSCHSGYAENRAAVLELITQIESKCTPTTTTTTTTTEEPTTTTITVRDSSDELNKTLEIDSLKAELAAEKANNEKLKEEKDAKITRLEEVNRELQLKLEAEIAKKAGIGMLEDKFDSKFKEMEALLKATKESLEATDAKIITRLDSNKESFEEKLISVNATFSALTCLKPCSRQP